MPTLNAIQNQSREPRAGEQCDSHGDRCDETTEPDQRVREAENLALPRVQVRAALHQHAEVAVEHRIRVGQDRELVEREGEGRPPAQPAGDDQEDRQDPGSSGLGRGVGHGAIIAGLEWESPRAMLDVR